MYVENVKNNPAHFHWNWALKQLPWFFSGYFFQNYFIKNPRTTNAPIFLTHNISAICGVYCSLIACFSVCLICIWMFQNRFMEQGSLAYDPLTGSFLTLQWRNIFLLKKNLASAASTASEAASDPLSLLLQYRYPRNDPINAKFNPFPGKYHSS